MRINLLLTFDYELPLGGIKKSYDHSLFSPTNRLLDCVEKLNVPIVLFADILSYVVFKENNVKDYYQPFEEQLKIALKAGHDVQLHLHPHWLETRVDDRTFYPSTKYKLADFKNDTDYSIAALVKKGVQELSEICRQVLPDYACIAYRGGGYNLEPCTEEILECLTRQGIKIDSSISRGYYYAADDSLIDYRKLPDLPNWYLSPNGGFNKAGKEGIYEIPIASRRKRIYELPTSIKLKFVRRTVPELRGKMIHTSNQISKKQKLNQLLSSRMLTVDNYTYSSTYLKRIFDDYIKANKKNQEISFCLIGHPKGMGEYAYFLLEELVEHADAKYGSDLQFCTYRDVVNRIPLI